MQFNQVLLVVAAAAALLLVITPCPSEAVLSGTGGVFKSPEAQAYFARRYELYSKDVCEDS